jgi:hypothetical protein
MTAAAVSLDQRPLLSRDEILGVDELRYETVPTDEWKSGSAVRVSSLTSQGRAELEDMVLARQGGSKSAVGIRETFVSICAVDAQGHRLFTAEDVQALGRKSARPIERIFEAATRLNDVSEQAVAREAGNSESAASDISLSPLP